MGRLNVTAIRAAKPAERDLWMGDGGGLWLRVRTSGTKVFASRIREVGKPKVITLGEYPGVTLSAARLEAAKQADLRATGVLRPELPPITVKELVEEFFNRRIRGRYKRITSAEVYRNRLIAQLAGGELRGCVLWI